MGEFCVTYLLTYYFCYKNHPNINKKYLNIWSGLTFKFENCIIVAHYHALAQARDARINSHQHHEDSWHMCHLKKNIVSSCNLCCWLIPLYSPPWTYGVAILSAGPMGHISKDCFVQQSMLHPDLCRIVILYVYDTYRIVTFHSTDGASHDTLFDRWCQVTQQYGATLFNWWHHVIQQMAPCYSTEDAMLFNRWCACSFNRLFSTC